MADVNGSYLKTEPESAPRIKVEQDGASPSPYMEEDDIYEDAGDLDFSTAGNPLWLTRLPAALWNDWSNLADDEEIEIGTVRVEVPVSDPTRVRKRSDIESDSWAIRLTRLLRSACG